MHRRIIAVALVCAVALALTGCAGGRQVVRLTPEVTSALRAGVTDASSVARTGLTDLEHTGSSSFKIPTSLTDALGQARAEASAAADDGSKLTAESRALIAKGDAWAEYVGALDDALKQATDWELNLPDDAVRLVAGRLSLDPAADTGGFRSYLQSVEERLLKSLRCQAARAGLDEVDSALADESPEGYDVAVPLDDTELVPYLIDVFASDRWTGWEPYLDATELIGDTIASHNKYVGGINAVLTAPSVSTAAAEVIYFRSCVLR